jgi:hypothetical protein
MRPRVALVVNVGSRDPAADLLDGGIWATLGRIDRVLHGQSRVRHVRVADESGASTRPPVSVYARINEIAAANAERKSARCHTGEQKREVVSTVDQVQGDAQWLGQLTACERLDLRFGPLAWRPYDILLRVPNLVRLELSYFDEANGVTLGRCVPRLAELRIERTAGPQVDEFVPTLLTLLSALRSLELPYATLVPGKLAAGADRLETLEVDRLADGYRPFSPPWTLAMPRLRCLTAHIYQSTTHRVLAHMPALRSGHITLTSVMDIFFGMARLHVHLDGRGDARWTYEAAPAADPATQERQAVSILEDANRLDATLCELRGVERHDVDPSVPDAIRDAIRKCERHQLSVRIVEAAILSQSPPPSPPPSPRQT